MLKSTNSKAKSQLLLDSYFRPARDSSPAPAETRLDILAPSPLDLLHSCKMDYSPEELKPIWKYLRPGERFRLDDAMLQVGLLFDPSQQVALLTAEQGLHLLDLPIMLASSDCHLSCFSGVVWHKKLDKATSAKLALEFAQVKYSPLLLGRLTYVLEGMQDWLPGDQFTIAAVNINHPCKHRWPLVIHNRKSNRLGVLAAPPL
ncbi:MAG TPA: hypothetical protein VKK79_26170 [Candidatus Lokiarchaeia archaeon]|nr:hypothetical protein [Candidatus Lokiarchaeia archaeon]